MPPAQLIQIVFSTLALPLVGIGMIVFAIRKAARLHQHSIALGLPKFGIDLKADAVAMLVLIGSLLIGAEAFFRYRDYDTKIGELNGELAKSRDRSASLEATIDGLKLYEMRLNPIFPEAIDPRRTKLQVYVYRGGQSVGELMEAKTDIGFANDIWLTLPGLNRGDRFRIVAYESPDKTWQSADIEIPKGQVQLTRVQQP